MPKFSGGVVRLLAVVAAVWLFQPLGTSLVRGEAGRDFPRCVQACNATRATCGDRCSSECGALYPGSPNKQQRDACINACKNICNQQSDDCKLICKNGPGTGEEP